ncbi:hypothetical protein D9758_017871 [Tetrapyrgos nigripes]|uniref:Uncharacterized protein n=1 Tax=Tetrapyrgos nigripes TaxID=182062 RepID=A0A8H5C376_9AGAR|nr:hypothetical protein D9758_017871 [Tetrapyrgos nigripes]
MSHVPSPASSDTRADSWLSAQTQNYKKTITYSKRHQTASIRMARMNAIQGMTAAQSRPTLSSLAKASRVSTQPVSGTYPTSRKDASVPTVKPRTQAPVAKVSRLTAQPSITDVNSNSSDNSSAVKPEGSSGLHGIAMYKMSSSPPGGEVTIPHVSTNPQDPKNLFTASAWLLFQNGSRHIVIVGNMNGDVVLWEWRTDHKCFETFIKIPAQASRDGDQPQAPDSQVMFLDVYERIVPDHHHGRIAASFSSRVVTVWSVSVASKEVTEVFRVSLEDSFIPVTVKFLSKLDLLVFKAKSGDICILDQKTGATKGRHIVAGEFLGQVCFNDCQDAFLVWTGKSFEMFSLENRQLLRVFGGNTSQSHLPRQVQFIEEGRLVLGGAEAGRKVQTVTDQASASSKHYFVAIAGSTISESNKVKVFFKLRPTPKVPKAAVIRLDNDWTLHMKLPWFFHAFYVACAVLGMAVLCIGLVLLAPIPETVYWLALWLYNLVQQGDTAPVAWTSRQDVVAPQIVVTPPVHFDGGKMAAQGVMGQEVSVVYDGSICVPPECITMGADSLQRTMKEIVISFFRLAVIAPLALAGMVSFAKGTVTLEDLKDIGEELKVVTRRIAGYLVLKTPDFLRFTAGFVFTWPVFSTMLAAMAVKYKNYYETRHGREPICVRYTRGR